VATRCEFRVQQPQCERASFLALHAKKASDGKDFASALALIEEAIRLDPIAGLNSFHLLRQELCAKRGQQAVLKAGEMYNHAVRLKKTGRYRDARLAYLEAAALDPVFLWPFNNLAWMLATAKDRSVRNGPDAVKYATKACEKSGWSCWAFVGTLAAAYAEAGDFDRAAGWQQASLELVPTEHRLDAELMLKHFQLRQPYVDEGRPVAAGYDDEEGHDSRKLIRPENISLEALRQLFQEAYLEVNIDKDNDLWVVDELKVLVLLAPNGSQIAFRSFAKANENASMLARLQFANRINSSIRVVRATVENNGMMMFDYTVCVVGGITRQALVFALRYFIAAAVVGKEKCDVDCIFGSRVQGRVSFSEN
jgi:tetratricopeptide (TPR) repeat protein